MIYCNHYSYSSNKSSQLLVLMLFNLNQILQLLINKYKQIHIIKQFSFLYQRSMKTDSSIEYQKKCNEFDELNHQFSQYQEQCNFIINDLQEQIKELKRKNQSLNKQLSDIKQKRKNFNNCYQKQLELSKKQKQQFKNKFMEFQKKVIQLQNINESLQSDLRATKATLYEYEQRTQKTMEQLAFLQIQMQESSESNKQQIARLKAQLKQTEDEIFALHHSRDNKVQTQKNQKENMNKNDQSFHSKSSDKRVIEIGQSKIKHKNIKFAKTLQQIRSFIKTIGPQRQKLSKRFENCIQQ